MSDGLAEASVSGTHPEKVELAYEEGHDADIPSNAGVLNDNDTDYGRGVKQARPSISSLSLGHVSSQEKREGAAAEVIRITATKDDNIVDWDGENDPENPMNWSTKKKGCQIALLSVLTLITPLASSMFAPAVPDVQKAFHNDSTTLAEFVVSVYILGFAIVSHISFLLVDTNRSRAHSLSAL